MVGKKELKIAKSLFRKSLSGGSVDSKKVNLILKAIVTQKPAHMVGILRNYKRFVEAALKKEEVLIESAAKIANVSSIGKEIKEKTHAKRITYKINPAILIGARIIHGDWIFDSTLDTKLQRLTMND